MVQEALELVLVEGGDSPRRHFVELTLGLNQIQTGMVDVSHRTEADSHIGKGRDALSCHRESG